MRRPRRIELAAVGLLAAVLATASDPPLGLDAYMPIPPDNPPTAEKIVLGRKLFFEKRLSRDGTVSCGSCHDPDLAFTDREPQAVGIGGQRGTRRSPRLINRGYGRFFFWDGRAASLEEQALQPIENPIEMDLSLDEALERLSGDEEYVAAFREAFEQGPSRETLAKAIGSYVRTIVAGDAPYDRYVAGDASALTAQQRRGLDVFRDKGACTLCHLGPNLTDERFHNTGVGWKQDTLADPGRGEVSGDHYERGAFKTPGLREVARTPPYMHDGSLATLEDVVEFYDKGGEKNPNLDIDMQPLNLTDQEKADLVAFLEALNGVVREGVQ